MGASDSKTLKEKWAEQMKYVNKNRKKDGRKKTEMPVATPARLEAIVKQIVYEYPFLSSINDSAVITDHNLDDEPIIYCNSEFTDLTGYPKEEILGRNCRFLQGPYTDPKTVAQIRHALDSGTRADIQILNYRKDGSPFLNSFVMLPLHESESKEGPVSHFIAIQKDVTILVNPFKSPMQTWSVPEVCMWLDKNKGSSYISSFMKQEIDGKLLHNMTILRLQNLGVILKSEQTRLMSLIAGHSRRRQSETSWQDDSNDRGMMSETSDDEFFFDSRSETSNSTQLAMVGGGSRRKASGSQNNVTLLTAQKSTSRRSRKVAVTVTFDNDIRPSIRMVIPSGHATTSEIKRTVNKKMGRRYEMLKMQAQDGSKSGLVLTVAPTFDGISDDLFLLLDGVNHMLFVTDSIGVIVFANDAAWNAFGIDEDPCDTSITDLFSIEKYGDSLPYLNEFPSRGVAAQHKQSEIQYEARIKEIRVGKRVKLSVWTFTLDNMQDL